MEGSGLPKRFYSAADVIAAEAGGWQIVLDGRPAKTRNGALLSTRASALADAMAAEWQAQETHIDPATMPLTQRCMLVLDRGAADHAHWRSQIVTFLSSDLLCYRAAEPQELMDRQNRIWDPYLNWATRNHGIALVTVCGIMAIEQPQASLQRAADLLADEDHDTLCCLVAATEILGSAILAFALWQEMASGQEIFAASRVDEAWQVAQWGPDEEAIAREEKLKEEFFSIDTYLRLL